MTYCSFQGNVCIPLSPYTRLILCFFIFLYSDGSGGTCLSIYVESFYIILSYHFAYFHILPYRLFNWPIFGSCLFPYISVSYVSLAYWHCMAILGSSPLSLQACSDSRMGCKVILLSASYLKRWPWKLSWIMCETFVAEMPVWCQLFCHYYLFKRHIYDNIVSCLLVLFLLGDHIYCISLCSIWDIRKMRWKINHHVITVLFSIGVSLSRASLIFGVCQE